MNTTLNPQQSIQRMQNLNLEEEAFGERVEVRGGRPDYTVANPLQTPAGFTDYTVQEMTTISLWKQALSRLFQLHGFTPIDPPPVEYASNLQLTGGLDKQIFGVSRLQDGTITKLALPFDRTVPMAIFIAKNHLNMTFPYCRSDIGWSWRGENAQRGRYRAFIQADVDIVAPQLSALADAQCITTIVKGLNSLGVDKFKISVNHVEIAKLFLKEGGVLPGNYKAALRVIDKLKPDNEKDVIAELIQNVPELDREKARRLLEKMNYRGPLSHFKFSFEPDQEAQKAFDHLKRIEALTNELGVSPGTIEFALNLTRGLNYYTGVVFETFIPGKEKYGSIASGGRYDNLVGEFNSKVKLQGVGGSIGMTRLFDVMKEEGALDLSKQTTAKIFVGYRTEYEVSKACRVATALRDAGFNVELETVGMKVKKGLELANKKGPSFAVYVMNPNEIIIKDLSVEKSAREQTPQDTCVTIQDTVNRLKQILVPDSRPQKPEESKHN